MHLAFLLFLAGVVSAYPLKPAQESQLVPREPPQPHCFHPMNGQTPILNPSTLTYMRNCADNRDAVGWLPQPPSTSLKDYKKLWPAVRGEPPGCVVPLKKPDKDELGFCFVVQGAASTPATQHRPARPQVSQPPAPPSSPKHLPTRPTQMSSGRAGSTSPPPQSAPLTPPLEQVFPSYSPISLSPPVSRSTTPKSDEKILFPHPKGDSFWDLHPQQ